MTRLVAQALALAAAELPVFPCAGNKRPCIGRREGGRGFHDATTEPDEVVRLFRHPAATLIGVPTGRASGFDVLDFDYRHGAAEWESAHAHDLPETRAHRTQSGGKHLLFVAAHGVGPSAGRFAPGMDVRGTGGYIIHPPSPGYQVISAAPISHWPDWLLQPGLVLPKAKPPPPISAGDMHHAVSSANVQRFIDDALDRVRGAPDGQKHFTLRNNALLLGGIQSLGGFSDAEAMHWLIDALPAGVRNWKTAISTAEWGLAIGRNHPIDLPPPRPTPLQAKAIARLTYRLLRAACTAERAWQELQAFAQQLGVDGEAARRIALYCIQQQGRHG